MANDVWEVKEVGCDGTEGEYGPFDSFQEAVSFVSATFPWSGEYLSQITISKVSDQNRGDV